MSLPNISAMFDLSGKVAIVTGAAEGMGKEVARTLAAAGATIAIADINFPLAEESAREIEADGGKATATKVDMAQEADIVAFVRDVRRQLGSIDIVVNVAGVQNRALLPDITAEFWDRIQAINLRGPFFMLRETVAVMRADGVKGRIVNISSMGSIQPILEGLVPYNASKGGINAMTRNVAYEVYGDGITVNAVLPGNIRTPGQVKTPGPPIDMSRVKMPPLGRVGTVEDIAGAVLYLVSPVSEWITAQTLVVDGGSTNS